MVNLKVLFLAINNTLNTPIFQAKWASCRHGLKQGTLTEGEDLVRLTSTIRSVAL
jgi:hypothetical protein